MIRLRLGVMVLAALASLAMAGVASAATFSVAPTQIFLAGKATTALLTVKNDSSEPVRFQLSAFAWQQLPSGEMQLAATSDVVFFPALLTLGPNEERKIRIGSTVTAAAQERTYRVFVEELPPDAPPADAAAVRVLTRMGVPVFIRPAQQSASATLADLGLNNGALRFSVTNSGTVHFVPEKVLVRVLSQNNEALLERELQSWYILAGGRRDFDLAVPPADCGKVERVTVDVTFNSNVLRETLQTPGGACLR